MARITSQEASRFSPLARSLFGIESGGNWLARGPLVGGDRAYGIAQVMGNNVPSWTQQYYGRRLTPNQYLNNKEAQIAVINGKMQEYLTGAQRAYPGRNDQTYVRMVAAKWFSGRYHTYDSASISDGYTNVRNYTTKVWSDFTSKYQVPLEYAAKPTSDIPSSSGGVTEARITPSDLDKIDDSVQDFFVTLTRVAKSPSFARNFTVFKESGRLAKPLLDRAAAIAKFIPGSLLAGIAKKAGGGAIEVIAFLLDAEPALAPTLPGGGVDVGEEDDDDKKDKPSTAPASGKFYFSKGPLYQG